MSLSIHLSVIRVELWHVGVTSSWQNLFRSRTGLAMTSAILILSTPHTLPPDARCEHQPIWSPYANRTQLLSAVKCTEKGDRCNNPISTSDCKDVCLLFDNLNFIVGSQKRHLWVGKITFTFPSLFILLTHFTALSAWMCPPKSQLGHCLRHAWLTWAWSTHARLKVDLLDSGAIGFFTLVHTTKRHFRTFSVR